MNRELLVLFPVNCDITFLFLRKRDFGNRRKPCFFIMIIICETRIGCLIHHELSFSFMLFSIFERNYNLNCSIEADQLSEYDDDSSDDNDSVVLGGERTWDFTVLRYWAFFHAVFR